MYTTKDGKKFGSAFVGRKKDAMHSEAGEQDSAAHEAKESPEFEKGEQEGMKEAGSSHPVVAQHGKARKIHIKHDHAAKKHHVRSEHEDGHVNESDHASAEEAHDEAAQLGGGGMAPAAKPGPESLEQPEPDGFKMPRLA